MKHIFILCLCCAAAFGQTGQLSRPVFITNREVSLAITGTVGQVYRVDAATNLSATNNRWSSLASFQSTGVNQHTDSAAPFSFTRFYRAEQLTNPPAFTGDHLSTTNGGDIIFRPINHASFIMSWNGKVIYNDPVGGSTPYANYPRADLILVSHSHSDHFHSATIDAVRGPNCIIIAPQNVTNSMSAASRAVTTVMFNNTTTSVHGITIQAIPAYNANHPVGTGNGYVLNIGGRRILMTGDTGNIPEIRALTNIDAAFICMNVPFTMTPVEATNSVRAFRPSIVYPYHYRDSPSNATTNAAYFKQILGLDPGVEVRLRKWY